MAGPAAATPVEGDVVRSDLAKGTTDAPISTVTNGKETAFYVQSLMLKPGASVLPADRAVRDDAADVYP
ncbi:MAG: cupin [Mycobacterium sp.]|nr:cupin [Mycobacterium sp.]